MSYPDPDWLERQTDRWMGWACDDRTMTQAMVRMLVPIGVFVVAVALLVNLVAWCLGG